MTEANPPPEARRIEHLAAFLRLIPEDGPLARLLKGAALLETPNATPAELASDLLHGAGAISRFMFRHEKHRRKVYRLIEAGKLPHFRIGATICSRKSVLLGWVKRQEAGSVSGPQKTI